MFDESDSEEVERLLVAVRSDGLAGDAARQVDWFAKVRSNPLWDPSLVFLVRAGDGHLAGVAHSWVSGFIKDLGVADADRRRGLAKALIGETGRVLRSRGFRSVELKVRPANIPARLFYRQIGFEDVSH